MTCVIKKSLFTHQSPATQRLSLLDRMSLRIRRSTTFLMSSSATYTGPWLLFWGDIHRLGCMKRGLTREIYKRAKEKPRQGQLMRLISYTVKGESISTFWNLTFQYYWYAKSGSYFVPTKKDNFSVLLLDNRDMKSTWNQSLNFCAMKTKDGTVPCLWGTFSQRQEWVHTHSPGPLSWVLRLGNFTVIS